MKYKYWQIFIQHYGLSMPGNKKYTVIDILKNDSFTIIIYKWLNKNKIISLLPEYFPKSINNYYPISSKWLGYPNWFKIIQNCFACLVFEGLSSDCW